MSKSYACAICTKRVGPKERRKLKTDGNKQLIKYLRKHMLLTDEVTDKDVVHNSCRLKYTAESAAARLSASPKKNPQHGPSDKKSPCLRPIHDLWRKNCSLHLTKINQ
ncbi:hypothetical protein DPMN_054043 [Dreissena polymorpha]|uniref:Uncharacterized protein n=1 Tax=Dreissena polymorpha TaxID=45954 RepID=A0A9D4HR90_DREPO|nr:hypothetical protein DPMN_054043 [Dreissena polymorpha]